MEEDILSETIESRLVRIELKIKNIEYFLKYGENKNDR